MADINVEMLKEKLYPVAKALFIIGETLVDESKMHISAEDAIKKIRSYMHDVDVIGSRLRVDKLIAECMEPQIYNTFEKQQDEWLTKYWGKWIGLESPEINYPDCCDGCSNNPKNGGSGICNCTLPYLTNPIMYNTTCVDDSSCMVNNIEGRAFIVGERKPGTEPTEEERRANAKRIAEAIANVKRYKKR